MKLYVDNDKYYKAYEIANRDIRLNIKDYESNLTNKTEKVLFAGLEYSRPWTRDASINIFSASFILDKELMKDTLLVNLEKTEQGIRIGGQYWDSIIWALGAERYYDVTGDKEFFKIAKIALINTLEYFEENEYSEDYRLFRGGAVYGDGVGAYPIEYGDCGGNNCILEYPKYNKDKAYEKGYGIPMHVLSTNCIYYKAYQVAFKFTEDDEYSKKAEKLKESILNNFYKDEKLKYITGPLGDFYEQEGLGIAFGILFGILPESLIDKTYLSKHGIPCVYPVYKRYQKEGHCGRHNGTVWPFIQGFFDLAAVKAERYDVLFNDFIMMADKAIENEQFNEIYHPETGKPYGGLQENGEEGIIEYKSCPHQTWSATAYISVLFHGILGLDIVDGKIKVSPHLPNDINHIRIEGIKFKDDIIDIEVKGKNGRIKSIKVNGIEMTHGGII